MASIRAATLLFSLCPLLASAATVRGPARVLVAAANPQKSASSSFSPSTLASITSAHADSRSKFLQKAGKKKRAGADVYYVAESLDRLKFATAKQQLAAEERYRLENLRLMAATTQAQLPADRSLLETTVQVTAESQMEEMNAFKALYNMYYTLKANFGSVNTAPSCELMTCGEHARCVSVDGVATCQCKPCFAGNGFMCKPSSCSPTNRATAQPIAPFLKKIPAMEDISVAVFQQDRIVAAFRDKKQNNGGFLLVGKAREADIEWGQMQPISSKKDLKVYSPQIIATATGRIVVVFRDGVSDATGYLVGGYIVNGNGTDAGNRAVMLEPTGFVKSQTEAASLVALASYRVVCLYAHPEGPNEQAYGGAIFLQLLKGGSLSILGKYRFAEHKVTNIRAVALRPTSFVVAYRDPPPEDGSTQSYSRELSVIWMSMQDDELMVDPHPIVLEPNQKDMGVRDVSLVSENLFSYSYQSRGDSKTKLAIVRVDPDSHRMQVTDDTKVVAEGETPFVKSISLPFLSLAPHTLTYLQHPNRNSVAETCRITPKGKISDCQELPWANTHVSDVTATRLGDGRLVFVFADEKQDPYYQMLGAPSSG
jgi:hypothetical protein